ncbi:hypothetical protein COL26b_013494 [Colletotrichum chrysophilum]|uniref:uncharacterized protein n=1 Tax=Colletotrichum chrysophilum TaxID=1836956 RepID=UPI002300E33A|nr:uncharacterized protein COL26b_013494 [Colletotrichum chrysophilum]KAJ0340155.1 hypothetical protein KNSL1_011708 [Colletotrichum chrysophilum]KAJ0362047.1 hypothetical protein COL26b_013494 [Colletotrichum chrysophilum]
MSRQINHEALNASSLAVHVSSSPDDAYRTSATLNGVDALDLGRGDGLLADNYIHGLLDLNDQQAIDGEGVYQDPNMPERVQLRPQFSFPFADAGQAGRAEVAPDLAARESPDLPLFDLYGDPGGLQHHNGSCAEFDAFSRRLEQLQSDQTSLETKKLMFSVIVDKILPYRYGDGARSFPCVAFYETLFYNEASRDVKKFGAECAAWFGQLTVEEADHYSATITEYHQSLRSAVSTCQQKVTASGKKKTRKSAKTSRVTDHQNQLLKTELEKPLTIGYDALIDDLEEASILDRAYLQHLRQTSTAHVEDPSWPSTKEKRRAYVKQTCEGIFDMRDFQEKKDALGKLTKLEAKHGNTNEADAKDEAGSSRKRKLGQEMPKKIPGLSTFDAVYVDPRSTPTHLLRTVTRCDIKNIERIAISCQDGWELKLRWSGDGCPGWERYDTFEERWDQICFNMRHHKVTIHSALRGDCLSRLAAGPVGERKMKLRNKSVNSTRDVQNELGRAELKRQKTGARPQSKAK